MPLSPLARTCAACGDVATAQCGPCRIRYCSLECQRKHWKTTHKALCAKSCETARNELVPAAVSGDMKRLRRALDDGAALNYICTDDIVVSKYTVIKNGSVGTALALAAGANQVAIIEELLLRGADPDAQVQQSACALMVTVKFNFLSCAKALLAGGATVDKRSEEKGWTSLHHACANGLIDMAILFLDAGADINALTNEGDSPLFVVAKCLSFRLPVHVNVGQYVDDQIHSTKPAPLYTRGHVEVLRLIRNRGGILTYDKHVIKLTSLKGLGEKGSEFATAMAIS